jgi:hypothetical protein
VNLDLAGFEVSGPGSCSGNGSGLVCTGGGSSNGISSNGWVEVHDGSVRGFGIFGLALGSGRVESVRVSENGFGGLIFSHHGSATKVNADRNGGDGINTFSGIVERSTASFNKGTGINASISVVMASVADSNGMAGIRGDRVVVMDSVVHSNAAQGISAGSTSVVRTNVASFNTGDGIAVQRGSVVLENGANSNGQAGIAATSTSNLQGNAVTSNSGVGLYLAPDAGAPAAPYSGNVVSGNVNGTVTSGINMGTNSCNGKTTCP